MVDVWRLARGEKNHNIVSLYLLIAICRQLSDLVLYYFHLGVSSLWCTLLEKVLFILTSILVGQETSIQLDQ